MKAYIIGDKNNNVSVEAVKRCKESFTYPLEFFQQTSPKTLEEDRNIFSNISWTYPLNDSFRIDEETGMTLRGYRVNSLAKVFSCTISHAKLWLKCVESKEDTMILEHDAIFTRKFKLFDWEGGVLGLNDPRGATHSSMFYHSIVSRIEGVQNAPWVKPRLEIPQGLAGNSAYIIKPYFAEKLLEKLKQKGAWPNDSIMCKQFFHNELKVIYPYYTRVQGVQSTTTL